MSDANRTAVRYIEEVTPGTTPASPVFQEMRITSSNLGTELNYAQSQELRNDRQVTDQIQTGQTPGGNIPVEIHMFLLKDLARGLFQSEWLGFPVRSNEDLADTVITDLTSGTGVITHLTDATNYRVNNGQFRVGHLVRHAGFTNAGNNGLFRVSASSATSYTIPTAGLVTEATVPITARAKCVGFQGVATDIAATASGLTTAALNFITIGLVPGMWVEIGGATTIEQFATGANNGWCRVSAVTSTTLTFDVLPTGWATDTGTGKTITVYVGDAIRNGTTQRAYTLEEEFVDITDVQYYRGSQLDKFNVQISAQQILTGSLDFLSLTSPVPAASRLAGATTRAAVDGDILAASDGVGQLLENGAVLGSNIPMALNLSISNSLRRRNALGVRGSASLGAGRFVVTGSLNTYYFTNAILVKARNSTASSFMTRVLDPIGTRGWVIDMPRIKFLNGNPTVPGVDQDRMLDVPIQAFRSPTYGYTMQFQQFEEHV